MLSTRRWELHPVFGLIFRLPSSRREEARHTRDFVTVRIEPTKEATDGKLKCAVVPHPTCVPAALRGGTLSCAPPQRYRSIAEGVSAPLTPGPPPSSVSPSCTARAPLDEARSRDDAEIKGDAASPCLVGHGVVQTLVAPEAAQLAVAQVERREIPSPRRCGDAQVTSRVGLRMPGARADLGRRFWFEPLEGTHHSLCRENWTPRRE